MANIQTTAQKSISDKKPKFSAYMNQDNIRNLVQQAVGKNAQSFTASIISAVSNNPQLQECTQNTILSAALLGESLKLSPSPQLGQYYLVPFAKKDKNGNVICYNAQFVLGAKGYKQLAMRSGQYLDIDVLEIKEGEYKGRDRFTGKQKFEFVEDDDERDALPTIGYMAYFELLNGFKKVVYWTKDKMIKHANTYSAAFNAAKYDDYINGKIPQKELYKYSSFWYKNFDEMAFKTMLRYLISQWGIMSIEMQSAMGTDLSVLVDLRIYHDGEYYANANLYFVKPNGEIVLYSDYKYVGECVVRCGKAYFSANMAVNAIDNGNGIIELGNGLKLLVGAAELTNVAAGESKGVEITAASVNAIFTATATPDKTAFTAAVNISGNTCTILCRNNGTAADGVTVNYIILAN